MPNSPDRYELYYADKLWNLIPAVYRAEDTDNFDANGPLRELVNRIGAQAAILRRSIDRLWEDQSIESCDDWLIPYIGDLLATNLVASLDARGQRLDVAKTIYYRRRKGTVALLEELAHDITGWDARVVEFFRRMGRTRHSLDPEIGMPAATLDPAGVRTLQLAEGLIGPLTGSAIGGWADLRNVYGASRDSSQFDVDSTLAGRFGGRGAAFDEFFHLADFRKGRGQVGWHDIPRLGVFLWRLLSFGVDQTTPVADVNCLGQFTFDPTGREIPLFAAPVRAFGDAWVSPAEWQLPTPISLPLLQTALAAPDQYPLYAAIDPIDGITVLPNALGVFHLNVGVYNLVAGSEITADPRQLAAAFFVDPTRGRLIGRNNAPGGSIRVTYHYGFSSMIGAGPYDRRILGSKPAAIPAPLVSVNDGGNALIAPLAGAAPQGTVEIGDFLTYDAVSGVGSVATPIAQVTIGAANKTRPLIRLPAPAPNPAQWVFTGGPDSDHPGNLTLDGLFLSGGDIVLRGVFDTVAITCCTFDPGGAGAAPAAFAKAVDGRDLIPCHIVIEGQVRNFTIDRSIVGPIATAGAGEVETLTVANTIIQSLGAERAIDLVNGGVDLSRCTVLGPARVHRLEASECILDDVMIVEDTQHGCVRFSAWATASVIPRQYESVEISAGAPLFTSRVFGNPGYAQLMAGVDANIVSGAADATISAGAVDGSEMGAFARDRNPIKERSLLIKYQEYMPLGLVPVIIDVT
jgi:hypothetical protein